MPTFPSVAQFVEDHARLIELERCAEVDEGRRKHGEKTLHALQREGVALAPLSVADEAPGLEGRTLLRLTHARPGELPAGRVRTGDLVSVAPVKADAAPAGTAFKGVVYRMDRGSVTVALDEAPDERLREPLRLDRVANDTTYRRWSEALSDLRDYTRGGAKRMREIAFGISQPRFHDPDEIEFFNEALDASQREAIGFALSARDLALIHGPPGTGKTTAVVELIRQALARGERVLACAPSNVAVDNLAERLARSDDKLVRVGHPARFLPAVIEHSLDALV